MGADDLRASKRRSNFMPAKAAIGEAEGDDACYIFADDIARIREIPADHGSPVDRPQPMSKLRNVYREGRQYHRAPPRPVQEPVRSVISPGS